MKRQRCMLVLAVVACLLGALPARAQGCFTQYWTDLGHEWADEAARQEYVARTVSAMVLAIDQATRWPLFSVVPAVIPVEYIDRCDGEEPFMLVRESGYRLTLSANLTFFLNAHMHVLRRALADAVCRMKFEDAAGDFKGIILPSEQSMNVCRAEVQATESHRTLLREAFERYDRLLGLKKKSPWAVK